MNIKTLILTAFLGFSSLASATLCETEMKKFTKFSDAEKSYVCRDLKSDGMFKTYSDCLLSTGKKFDPTFTSEKLYQTDKKSLSGIMSLCSGGLVSTKPSGNTSQ